MKALRYRALTVVVMLGAISLAQSGGTKAAGHLSMAESSAGEAREKDMEKDKEKLIGAWHLAWMEEPGPDGKVHRITDREGMLLYTRDGHMSVPAHVYEVRVRPIE